MNLLPRRLRRQKNGPRHALPAGGPPAPGVLTTGPFPAMTPGSMLVPDDFRRPLLPPAAQETDGDDETALFTPDFAEEGTRKRPYAPEDSGPPPSAEAPSAWLRAIPVEGRGSRVVEALAGLPFFAGIRHDLEGGRAAGVCLGAADDIWLVLDTRSAGVLDAGIAALTEAREHLVYGGFRDGAGPAEPAEPGVAIDTEGEAA